MIIGFLIFVVAALLLAATGKQLFPSWPFVWVFGIIAAAVLIYYSFVYRRACKLKAEIAKEKERLQFGYGRVN
jgi:undecaprenyl pyrophosphate phosphatase UppP